MTEKELNKLKAQVWLNKNDIMCIECCGSTFAERKMKQAREWLRKKEGKEYPRKHILSKDYFEHIWLVPPPPINRKKAPATTDAK